MSKAEKIGITRADLFRQWSQKTGENPASGPESIFTDEMVALALDLGLAIA